MIDDLKIQKDLTEALDSIRQVLNENQAIHVIRQEEENPYCFTCAAKDHAGYLNVGFVAWDKENDRVTFLAYDPLRANHDEAEGIPLKDSKCFWDAKNVENFILHLTGDVREIVKKHRETISQKILDN